jgi:antitoxin YefM
MIETSYTIFARAWPPYSIAWPAIKEVVIVSRRSGKKAAMVPADELAGLMETAHLLRSPRSAQRLQSALRRATGSKRKPELPGRLRREMGPATEP